MEQGFTYEASEQMLVIHLPKEVDHHNCTALKNETDLILAENYVTRMIFDFTDTQFMDSSGIGLVMGRYKLMQELNGKVTVRNPPNHIRKVMRLSGIDRLASISSGQEGI